MRFAYRRSLVRRLAALAALSPLLFSTEASAEPVTGGSFFVSCVFGEKVGWGWGGELFTNFTFNGQGGGLGPTIQLSTLGTEAPRLMFGIAGGGNIGHTPFVAEAELGIAYRYAEKPGYGLHLGLVGAAPLGHFFVRGLSGLHEYSIGGGPRLSTEFGTYNPAGVAVSGRPLRGEEGLCRAPEVRWSEGESWAADREDYATYAAHYANDAAAEYASVAAFLQVAAELLAFDAPDHLVDWALRAAEEEIGHAYGCAQVAGLYAGRTAFPVWPKSWQRVPRVDEAYAVRMALETWTDGCLGEGAAAAQAQQAARCARVPAVRALQQRIAVEEARHAALGQAILTWLANHPTYGARVRDALAEVSAKPAATPAAELTLPRNARPHGLLAVGEINALARAAQRQAHQALASIVG